MNKVDYLFLYILLVFTISTLVPSTLNAQTASIDHWETVVYADDLWSYQLGTSTQSSFWNQLNYNDANWSTGFGGFGYGDSDDNTVISPTRSVYLRHVFTIADTSNIALAVLHADYDDGFVAYLNGVEIARANIGEPGVQPAYNETCPTDHEAQLYQGNAPESFTIGRITLANLLTNGENVLAIQVHNVGITSTDLSSNFFLSVGIKDDSSTYGDLPEWFYEPFNSSNLPIVIIHTNGQEIEDDPRIVADMGIIYNGTNAINNISDPFNIYDGKISIEIRGASSQGFPKNNYSLETQDEFGENNNVEILGLPEENDWILHGPFSDKSLMRNVLTYHMGREMGHWAPRTRYCELYINDQYRGIYVFLEKVKRDDNRLDIANLKPEDIAGEELTGGYIVQIDRDREDVDDGWYSNFSPPMFYAYSEPDYSDIMPEQKAYIQDFIADFEGAMSNPNYATLYEQYVDVPTFIDYWIVNEISKEVDAFRLSFYLYKDKDTNNDKLQFGPLWDFNLGYGNYDYCPEAPVGWAYQFPLTCGSVLPFWINRLLSIPAVRDQIHCRWEELRASTLSNEALFQFIDDQVEHLGEAVDRNFQRWPVLDNYVWPNSFVGGSYPAEINFLKEWLTDRLEWMDNQMVGSCGPVQTEEIAHAPWIKIAPNPFRATTTFEFDRAFPKASQLRISNLLGQTIITFPVPSFSSTIQWNGKDASNKELKSGIYIYTLESEHKILEKGKVIKH